MEGLLELLKALESATEIDGTHEFLSLDIPIVAEISRRAEELLITSDGNCDWGNMATVYDHGFRVFPVERDSFGWVLGGISTTKGVITYG